MEHIQNLIMYENFNNDNVDINKLVWVLQFDWQSYYYLLHLLVRVMFYFVTFKIKYKSHLYWCECNYY